MGRTDTERQLGLPVVPPPVRRPLSAALHRRPAVRAAVWSVPVIGALAVATLPFYAPGVAAELVSSTGTSAPAGAPPGIDPLPVLQAIDLSGVLATPPGPPTSNLPPVRPFTPPPPESSPEPTTPAPTEAVAPPPAPVEPPALAAPTPSGTGTTSAGPSPPDVAVGSDPASVTDPSAECAADCPATD